MELNEYIKPELLVLVPVMSAIGKAIKKSAIADKFIPWILGGVSVALSALWIVATSSISNASDVMIATYTTITQGVLIAAASVYFHQLAKQTRKDE